MEQSSLVEPGLPTFFTMDMHETKHCTDIKSSVTYADLDKYFGPKQRSEDFDGELDSLFTPEATSQIIAEASREPQSFEEAVGALISDLPIPASPLTHQHSLVTEELPFQDN